jgi:hypothetical protein
MLIYNCIDIHCITNEMNCVINYKYDVVWRITIGKMAKKLTLWSKFILLLIVLDSMVESDQRNYVQTVRQPVVANHCTSLRY